MDLTSKIIEQNWSLTGVVLKEMPKQGMGGTVGIVESNEGKYTYKIAGSWKTAVNLDRDLSAYEFLNDKKFPYISQLLKTKSGQRFTQIEDNLIYLIKYIEGEHPLSTPETHKELGKITAELHSIQDFPFETDYKPVDAIPPLIGNAEKYWFKDEYVEILKSLPDFRNLSFATIHTEITPGNAIQNLEGKIMVIDWDEVGRGPAVLDLGVSLINHFITEDLEVLEDNARAYYQTYFSLRKMDESEKKYIFDAAVFWACCWITYGDLDKRWQRIRWAVKNRSKLEVLYREVLS